MDILQAKLFAPNIEDYLQLTKLQFILDVQGVQADGAKVKYNPLQKVKTKKTNKYKQTRSTHVQSEPIDQTCRIQAWWTHISAGWNYLEGPSDDTEWNWMLRETLSGCWPSYGSASFQSSWAARGNAVAIWFNVIPGQRY